MDIGFLEAFCIGGSYVKAPYCVVTPNELLGHHLGDRIFNRFGGTNPVDVVIMCVRLDSSAEYPVRCRVQVDCCRSMLHEPGLGFKRIHRRVRW